MKKVPLLQQCLKFNQQVHLMVTYTIILVFLNTGPLTILGFLFTRFCVKISQHLQITITDINEEVESQYNSLLHIK